MVKFSSCRISTGFKYRYHEIEAYLMLKKISFRLGMDEGLYIGICLGAILAAALTLSLILLFSPRIMTVLIMTLAIIIASVLAAAIVLGLQSMRKRSPDLLCTCRFRKSIYTYCRDCACSEKDNGPSSHAEKPEE